MFNKIYIYRYNPSRLVEQSLREPSRTEAHFRPFGVKEPVGAESAWLGRGILGQLAEHRRTDSI